MSYSSLSPKEKAIRDQRIQDLAMSEGITYGLAVAVAVGAATALAHHKVPKFNKFLSISAKMSFPLMTGIGMYAYKHETTQYYARDNPEEYGLVDGVEAPKKVVTSMPIHHRAINFMYDNPFYFIIGAGVPFAGLVLSEQLKHKHLTLSQRIMHSRVYAQAGVLAILMTTMGFRAYMDKHGRYPEPGEIDQRVPATTFEDMYAGRNTKRNNNHH